MATLADTKLCKILKTDWNPGTWVLIWEHSARAIQRIPTWQGFDGFQKSLHPYALDESIAPALEGLKGIIGPDDKSRHRLVNPYAAGG